MAPPLTLAMRSSESPESNSPDLVPPPATATPAPAITAPRSRCSPVLTPLVYLIGQHIVLPAYFGPITITGQQHLPAQGPVILAPTHRARWDSIVLPLAAGRPATGRDLRFMVTADEVKGLQGWFIRRLGGFPVNVRRPSVASLRHGIELLTHQDMLVIYPEGGIRREDKIHSLKPGLARMAVQAESATANLNVQVLPVDIYYGEAYPRWRCPVQVNIGAPLAASQYLNGNESPEALKAGAKQLTIDLKQRLEAMVQQRQDAINPPHNSKVDAVMG